MRIVKFRAYHKGLKRFCYGSTIFLLQVLFSRIAADPDAYELSQYIGLLDKTGEDIYEGDIVGGLRGIHLDGDKHEINFVDGVFGVDGIGFKEGESELNWTIDNIEVIGNIYRKEK